MIPRRPSPPSNLRLAAIAPTLALTALAPACKGSPDEAPWCGDALTAPAPATAPVTWHRDVAPILAQKCTRCHDAGGIAPYTFTTYADASSQAALVRKVVADRSMPPFLAATCCTDYENNYALTDDEIATILAWADGDRAEGDLADAPTPRTPLGGLSRVDVLAELPEAYTPKPPAGTTDDLRCFVLDWPLDRTAYVTGLDPRPGNRELVHHLVVGVVGPEQAGVVEALDANDPGLGFDCSGGFGDIDDVRVLGGSLLGGDFPRDLGARVEPGSKLLLNIHYSTAKTTGSDRTALALRVGDSAREAKVMAVLNPLWIAGDAFHVEAGDDDAVFFYRFIPELFTQGKPVLLESVTPHMHYFGSKIGLRVIRADGTRQCLLDIPRWEFGWEQPYWFAEPQRLEPGDELYIECHYDNSAKNQSHGGHEHGGEPRDFSWGGDNQDMCAGFLLYTELDE